MTTTAVKSAATTAQTEREPGCLGEQQSDFCSATSPLMLRKRIGSTTFVVSVRFSATSTETLEDKVLKIIEREAKEIA